jgi:methylmalonyl-CoA/ethylmalonyl-CoA epimerase
VPHIDGLWHSTIMGPDYDRILEPLQRLFGAVVMHHQYSEAPEVGRSGGMIWIGDNSVEIGAPVGPQSPVRKFVERLGGGMHSMALRVTDVPAIDEMKTRFAGLDVNVVATIGDQVFFTAPADTGGLLLEWSAMQTDDDPRFGYDLPSEPPESAVTVTNYGFVSAVVEDPITTAEQFAGLFGTEVVRTSPDAGPGEIGATVSLVDNLLVLFALPADDGDWPWGPGPTRPRFHAQGLVVDDLDASLAALEENGVKVVGELEHFVLLDPSVLPAPTFLADRLLPEDPRAVRS